MRFESFVNSEEYQTWVANDESDIPFESFVNSEEYQTCFPFHIQNQSLRALLIQKSIKLLTSHANMTFLFESFVNSEEYQTNIVQRFDELLFESFVNSEEYQTAIFAECDAR